MKSFFRRFRVIFIIRLHLQVPVPVKDSRARLLAIRWIIETAADKERHVRFSDQLAKELVDASQNVGRVIHKKQEMHKLAEANKAFAHYRYVSRVNTITSTVPVFPVMLSHA